MRQYARNMLNMQEICNNMQNMQKSCHVMLCILCILQYEAYAEYEHVTIIWHIILYVDAYICPYSEILFHILCIFCILQYAEYAEFGQVTIILHIILHICAYNSAH